MLEHTVEATFGRLDPRLHACKNNTSEAFNKKTTTLMQRLDDWEREQKQFEAIRVDAQQQFDKDLAKRLETLEKAHVTATNAAAAAQATAGQASATAANVAAS